MRLLQDKTSADTVETARAPLSTALPGAAARRAPKALLAALEALERQRRLDAVAVPARNLVRALPLGKWRDVLHGLPLGHPLHPLLVQVPLGAWLSAGVLDLLPGEQRAARRLVAVGLMAALPAALAGSVDWAEQHQEQLRVGLVHAAFNLTAVGLYGGSLAARVSGHGAAGKVLGFAGLTAAASAGMLGGHLAYRRAVGANHAEQVPHLVDEDWHAIGQMTDFPVGVPVRRRIGEVPVVVVRESGGEIYALAEQCSHLAGPLSEGEVSDGCVRCPWHGSVFRLSDGQNMRGPATAPQPAFESRVGDRGSVELRLRR
jgi:nitrite reductase/ring-hydroxylating ferredoxin subunit/uncharacterized membrane protein